MKRKYCGEKEEIEYIYKTEMMLEKGGGGEEEDEVEEEECDILEMFFFESLCWFLFEVV